MYNQQVSDTLESGTRGQADHWLKRIKSDHHFETLAILFSSHCPCFSEETIQGVDPFNVVFGEEKDPIRIVNVTCCGLLEMDNSEYKLLLCYCLP